jgi:hypothetical protein
MAYAWFRSQSLPASRSAKRPKPIAPEVLIEQRTGGKAENDACPYQQQCVPWSDAHGKHCPQQEPQRSNSHMSDVVPVHLGSPRDELSPVAQLVLRAFFLCRLQHQLHLWDSTQQSLEAVTGDLGTVRHTERAARGTFVLLHWLGGLEDEDLAKAMDKPFGILNAIDSYPTVASQRT